MMFLLKWDPHLAASFQKIASQLKIFVCTSILIPALSEIYLDPSKRRYWTLLEGAYKAGVQLTINQIILDELVNHFGMIRSKYNTQYRDIEELYLADEISTLYVDEIMIRAYFYAKSNKKVQKFKDFLEEFAHPNLNTAHRDLRNFLEEEFNIIYEDTSEIEKKLDVEDIRLLKEALTDPKQSKEKALTDSKIILMIYKMRELNNEDENKSVFGYKTWWLSQDIITYKAIQTVFKDRFTVNCYMRSDFLYNYISLTPKKQEIDNMFKEVFPSMMGINLSYHLPKDICTHINKSLNEHSYRSPAMIKRAIRNYTEKLMSTPTKNSNKLMLFFDEELKKAIREG
jgi:predicted nucleic acid-binding protein